MEGTRGRLLRRTLAFGVAGLAGAAGTFGAAALWAASRRPAETDETADPPQGLPPARIVHVPGRGEFFVREAGDPAAPAVLLLHGWIFPADLNWWASYGPLAGIAHVLAPDHRGHGRGPRPPQPFRLTDVADDAAALLRHLDVERAVVVGYSMGGVVAQLLWRRHPEVVRGLVLCATAATFTETWRDRLVWRGMGLLQVLLRVAPRDWWTGLYRAQAAGRLPIRVSRLITEDTPPELEALLPWVVGELDRNAAEDIAEAGRELGRYDARSWIGEVDVPTVVLVALRDQLVPPVRQQDLAARIPGAVRDELPMDHDGAVARTDEFVPALVRAVHHVLGTDGSCGTR